MTLPDVAARWQTSRIDVWDDTRKTYATNLDRVLPALGHRVPGLPRADRCSSRATPGAMAGARNRRLAGVF